MMITLKVTDGLYKAQAPFIAILSPAKLLFATAPHLRRLS